MNNAATRVGLQLHLTVSGLAKTYFVIWGLVLMSVPSWGPD